MAVTAALFGSVLVAAPAQALNDTGSGGVFVPASGRILDTKNNIGGYNTPMPVKTWRTITVGGKVGVPNDGTVGAVSVVATVADISGQGILYGRPNDTVKTTTMGVYGGENKQNTSFAAVLAVDEDGTIEVQSETAVRLILDVQGYYTTDTSGTAAGGFVPLNGERIVDTRSALGAPKVALAPGKSIDVQVTGKAGIPAGASAAVVNMIAVNTTSTVGYLTPYPTGGTRPSNSFNYAGGVITSMSAQVKLSASGKMTIFNDNSTANIVVDIQGYFTAAGAGGAVFTPAAGRVYDTRTAGNTVMGTNETRSIQVAGVSEIPVMGSGIVAVVLTMTSLKSTSGGGNATVWADGTPRPYTTAINFDETTIRTNTITVPLGANGKISLGSVGGPTNYVFDIQGWYTNPTAPTINCLGPYAAGSWTTTLPSFDVACTVSAPAATATGQILEVEADGDNRGRSTLQSTGSSVVISVSRIAGIHSVTAVIADATGTNFSAADYQFGIGDWATKGLLPDLEDGSLQTMQPWFSVSSDGDSLPEDAIVDYTVTAPDGSTEAASGPITGSWSPPAKLASNTKYSWSATVSATSGGRSAIYTRTSPQWTFTTGDATTEPDSDESFAKEFQDTTDSESGESLLPNFAAMAASSSPLIDDFIAVNSVTVNNDRSVSVSYTKKRDVPSQATLTVAWYFPKETRDYSPRQSRYIDGAPGKSSIKFTGVPQKIMPVRIAFTIDLPQNREEKNYYRIIAPGSTTTRTTVTTALLSANVISSQIPGIALTLAPQTRLLKVAGLSALGWSVYSAFRDAFDLGKKGCPSMKVGQVIQQVSSTQQNGDSVKVLDNIKIWKSESERKQGKTPLCNVTSTLASYK